MQKPTTKERISSPNACPQTATFHGSSGRVWKSGHLRTLKIRKNRGAILQPTLSTTIQIQEVSNAYLRVKHLRNQPAITLSDHYKPLLPRNVTNQGGSEEPGLFSGHSLQGQRARRETWWLWLRLFAWTFWLLTYAQYQLAESLILSENLF